MTLSRRALLAGGLAAALAGTGPRVGRAAGRPTVTVYKPPT